MVNKTIKFDLDKPKKICVHKMTIIKLNIKNQ